MNDELIEILLFPVTLFVNMVADLVTMPLFYIVLGALTLLSAVKLVFSLWRRGEV